MRTAVAGFLSLLLVAAAPGAPAPADVLPFKSLFTREELQSSFDRHRIHPLGERELYFDVVVPKSWQARPVAVTQEHILEDEKRAVVLARLTPADREDVAISVSYVRAAGDDAARKTIELVAKQRGAKLIVGQRGDFSGRRVEDALLEEGTAGAERWLRLTASKHGELVFLVSGEAPRADYDAFKRELGAAAVSFAVGEGTIRRDYDPSRMTF